MKTPCIAACKNNDGICSGCHRTMDEIVNWRHLSDQERDQVMANLSGKTSTHNCPSCHQPAQCDISQGKSTCWCFEIEKRDTSDLPKTGTCLCRKCLSKLPTA
ncbi:cysteine-rich CWC family protein [Vibrio tubiashii]|uniref:cysteine-rich CWC family protein n=1 Tax=Vibrio tubiashii TaxID=29498 RepID=UPI001EFE50CD|nr:cysteine-rich CWC family protein [Vibrio tubiashii]MCG9576260.1 cysteine-rich CWC family protein [Vibrio tubiashii]